MTGETSPYTGKPVAAWDRITRRLLARHPLKNDVILSVAIAVWHKLWSTTVGVSETAIPLSRLDVPATIIGYFFEVLFAKELETSDPGHWRGNRNKAEKDLIYTPDPRYSVEIKCSGQLGLKVYGNRSYGQELQSQLLAKKEKSGYYLTVNFFGKALTLLRFGWIDARDWKPQVAPTGQMAGLSDDVYRHKLVPVRGDYQLSGPVRLLKGIGPSAASELARFGIQTIGDLLSVTTPLPPKLERIRLVARAAYEQG